MKITDLFENYGPVDTDGVGSIPFSKNIDYMGLRVVMRPSVFLKLAGRLASYREEKIEYLVNLLRSGENLGIPFLKVDFNSQDRDFDEMGRPIIEDNNVRIIGHEGRHRMIAIQEVYGDIPVEVHLFFRKLRKDDLTSDHINVLKNGIHNEDNNRLIRNPIIRIL